MVVNSYAQSNKQVTLLDSILSLRKLSNDTDLGTKDKIRYAELACKFSNELAIDTTRLKSNWNLSRLYLNYDMDSLFGKINHSNLKLAQKLKDTLYIGYTYQNLGYYFTTQTQNDSAYFNYYSAVKIYDRTDDIQNKAETLFTMANIQETERDYIGSEQNAIKGLKLIRTLSVNERNLTTIYDFLNLLAIISNRLGNYDEAIDYQNQAFEIGNKLKNSLFSNSRPWSW